ncbi:MAG: hypothetical protein B6242_02205 [Anaerolineaceae bacterium 4572_78]|nr:MAG: hypothetical protein B6242_02205 [Anaerolineaceae bacterium 4572_78]
MSRFEKELKQVVNRLFTRPVISAKELIRRSDLRQELEKRLDTLGLGLVINTKHELAMVYGLPEFEDVDTPSKEWVTDTMKAIIVALFIHLRLPYLHADGRANSEYDPNTMPKVNVDTVKKLLPNLSESQIKPALSSLRRLKYLDGDTLGPRLLTLPGTMKIRQALLDEEFFYSFERNDE